MSVMGSEYALSQAARTLSDLQNCNVADVSKAVKKLSHTVLSAGCGYAFASLSNGEFAIWYSLSHAEREYSKRCAVKLFSVRRNGETTEFVPETDTELEKFPYVREKLAPALQVYFTETLKWIAAQT